MTSRVRISSVCFALTMGIGGYIKSAVTLSWKPITQLIDTNVILHDASCINNFQENDIVIPLTVIEELDHFKGQKLYAHLNLVKGERSELAELASNLL